ncbi:MAG TPA: hypothetical protein VNZ67_00665, partial [bacterium]|nr:hypothetical protein [bacterium]
MQLAESKTRDSFPLSGKKILKKTLLGVLGWAVLALVSLAGSYAFLGSANLCQWWPALALGILALFLLAGWL